MLSRRDTIPLRNPSWYTTRMATHSRITVVENVYWSGGNDQPVLHDSKFNKIVHSDEQPYGPRRVRVGVQWRELETGWVSIDKCSLLCITNVPTDFDRVPTDEQIKEAEAKVLEIGFYISTCDATIPFALITPGRSLRIEPHRHYKYLIRCVSGEARYRITAFPE